MSLKEKVLAYCEAIHTQNPEVIAYAQSSGTVGGRRPADPAAGQRIHQAHRHQDDGCAGMKEES